MENDRKNLVPLERLVFATDDHFWDEAEALRRVQKHLGWGALSEYSLLVDFSSDPQAYQTYSFLVADIINDQPMIVPAALRAARQKVADLEGTDKEKVETVLEYLESLQGKSLENPDEDNQLQPDLLHTMETPDDLPPPVAGRDQAKSIVARLAGQGKIVPSMGYEGLETFIAGLSTEKTVQIEGAELMSAVEYFTGLMEALPCLVPVDELAAAIDRKAKSYEQVGRMIAQSLK